MHLEFGIRDLPSVTFTSSEDPGAVGPARRGPDEPHRRSEPGHALGFRAGKAPRPPSWRPWPSIATSAPNASRRPDAEKKAVQAADRALSEAKKAADAAEVAGRRLYFSLIDRARLEHRAANIAEAEAILDRCEPDRRGWECWDAQTGRPVHTLRIHKHLVRQVAFSRDSRLVASSSLDGTVLLLDADFPADPFAPEALTRSGSRSGCAHLILTRSVSEVIAGGILADASG